MVERTTNTIYERCFIYGLYSYIVYGCVYACSFYILCHIMKTSSLYGHSAYKMYFSVYSTPIVYTFIDIRYVYMDDAARACHDLTYPTQV